MGGGPMRAPLTSLVVRLAELAPGLRVETGPGATGPYAYDASNYRVPPRAVAFPRTADDVVAVLRACREAGVPVTARGGGTSMAGNAVGPGVVLDFCRYMNRILDIDAAARTARVEAGVVLDALRSATALHGLDFGPDPSSHSRCTLGGMIGNDACGNRSVRDGRTSGHVVALEIVTADGVRAVADHCGLHPVDSSRWRSRRTAVGRPQASGRGESGADPDRAGAYPASGLGLSAPPPAAGEGLRSGPCSGGHRRHLCGRHRCDGPLAGDRTGIHPADPEL
ncbi:FAD-binding oxidoreductase [Streptomyces luteogriseus]|uniref:FAD-binding oxidoreductase n=1 Tax=Streptomyces luteogriseus TaxID=68233 RepID=UPI0035931EA7